MVSSILKQTAGILRKQKNSKRWQKGFWCLAIAVVVGTVAILTVTGQALTHKTKVLNCQLEVHEHTDECYDEDDNLICGYADYVVHVHNDDCYDSEGNLVCTLPEIEEHEHTEDCYEEQQVLICEAAEAAGTEGHVHTEECYETVETGNACDKEEHTHDDSCYESTLTCDKEEHTHGDGCYDENGELICDKEEHTHGDSCYESTLTCGKEEHTHDDSCAGTTEKVLKCGKEESEGAAGHTHTEECYRTEKVLTCGELELHTHEQALVEDGGCYDESAFDEETGEFIEGSLPVCGLLQLEEHVHTEECFDVVELTDDEIEHLNQTFIKTCEDEGFKITAEYTAEAKIPAEAELIAEQISADSEHYAQREAEYKEKLEDENASMHALLKIGFYLNGEEIEPESDVTLTVQFLDENGLAEGSPITVVHFAEEGAEVLDGSEVENGSTTFRMDSFSEVAIGCRPSQNGGVYISQAFQYQDEAYTITFRVQGEAVPAEGEDPLPEGVTEIVSDEIRPVVSNTNTSIENTESAESVGENEDVPPVDETEETEPAEESQDAPASAEGNESSTPVEETENTEPTEEQEGGASDDGTENEAPAVEPEVPEEEAGENPDETEEKAEEINPVEILEFRLEQMGEDSAEYAAYSAYTENKDDGSQQIRLQVMKYEVSFGDIQLDLSECKVTAEIKPTQTLVEFAETGLSEASIADDGVEIVEGTQDLEISALQLTGQTDNAPTGKVAELDSMRVANKEADARGKGSSTIQIELNGENFAINLEGTPNPNFSVQYYAWLDRARLMKDKPSDFQDRPLYYLELIDTSKESNGGTAAKLPQNNKGTPKTAYLELESKTTGGKVKTEQTLTKLYEDREGLEYYKQPTIEYLNAPVVKANASHAVHYELKEIWVLKDEYKGQETSEREYRGEEALKDEKERWKRYYYTEDLHLTNRDSDKAAESGASSGYVYIGEGAVVRLVYGNKESSGPDDVEAAFYDYDISSEKTNGYMNTIKGGINSTLPNGLNTGAYAFGNQNCGTAFGWGVKWENNNASNKLNAGNNTGNGGSNTFKGCTFGLAQGVMDSSDGKGGKTVKFSSGVVGPEIFGTTDLTGKHQYLGTLFFNRHGDTYTLNEAQGENGKIQATNLSSFNHPKSYTHIWTNNFWPMDGVKNKDDHFGGSVQKYAYGIKEKVNGFDANDNIATANIEKKKALPPSDDGKEHNSFFGMSYEVNFELVKDYVGPLEYYFFGDDDMWVFLDAGTANEKLICDIGGVHSSVGEYVNLWDYLEVNHSDTPEKHTLSFFYTERGASGSTCWMQFTLPSVTTKTPATSSKDYGELRVEKTVQKEDMDGKLVPYDTGDEFTFAIRLEDADGNQVMDDYAFTKYNAKGEVLTYNLVLRDNGAFTLKNGEYVIVDHLRQGTKYTIVEQEKVLEGTVMGNSDYVYDTKYTKTDITPNDSGERVPGKSESEEGRTAEGTIPADGESQVVYTNIFHAYALPKTGGSGVADYTAAGILLTLVATAFCFGYLRRKNIRGDGL